MNFENMLSQSQKDHKLSHFIYIKCLETVHKDRVRKQTSGCIFGRKKRGLQQVKVFLIKGPGCAKKDIAVMAVPTKYTKKWTLVCLEWVTAWYVEM